MQIDIDFPIFETFIFGFIFLALLILGNIPQDKNHGFSLRTTTELKGFAILAIVLSHIGYFLAKDHNFLFPLSVLAGVGVNIFFFLSGFGLTISQLQKPLGVLQFYRKRLLKLFFPLWITLVIFFCLDFLLLDKTYTLKDYLYSFLGYFPKADIFNSVNSPLWYFTAIFFLYLIYPIFWFRKTPLLSALAVYLVTLFILQFRLKVTPDLQNLYLVHTFAFPLGMTLAIFYTRWKDKWRIFSLARFIRGLILYTLACLIAYKAIISGVGKGLKIEQFDSMTTTFLIILVFAIKRSFNKIFYLFGIFSYEIYLIHWPIMERFDFLYNRFSPSIATLLYLALFIILGYLLQKTLGIMSASLQKLVNLVELPRLRR